jgi:carboxyl-terminal processing protease
VSENLPVWVYRIQRKGAIHRIGALMSWKLLLSLSLLISSSFGGSQLNHTDGGADLCSPDAPVLHGEHPPISQTCDPEALYHKVWHLIRDDYLDKNFNGQSWNRWEHRYDGKLKTLADAHKCIETMLASLADRYTRFLDIDAFDDERAQIDAKLFGIGIQIGIDDHKHIIIVTPIEGTPADRAGLMAADEILEINGTPTRGLSVEEAAKLIRGAVQTDVSLTILRKGKNKLKVSLKRAEIPIHAVQTAKMIDGEIGYIRLSTFISQETASEMREAFDKLPKAKAIVLDLRDNPGGLLANAIEIANMFLDSGNIVSTVDRDGYKSEMRADGKPLCKKPLVVLINKGSASASEITSGALHDNNRAKLVGQKSFGKGLVQGINRLEDGSGVNVTIARYLTPSDTDINAKGIAPDLVVELSEKDVHDGKGPWWLDPSFPKIRRAPEDLKDLQLRRAVEMARTNFSSTMPVAIGQP